MKRDRTITLFFLVLRLSPDLVNEKSLGNLRAVTNTHNSRPHLASGRYGSDRRSSQELWCVHLVHLVPHKMLLLLIGNME